ncbi:MAG: septation protein SpoVG family protein [Fibrobacter sp.]|nr:septation protein SpoVG family protein [Fibrobacter sp.]
MNNEQKQIETLKEEIKGANRTIEELESEVEMLRAKVHEQSQKENAANVFDCLAVTNVQVFPFKEGPSMGHMKGLATVVFNDQLMLRGLRIMDGENGLFVGYPNDPFYKGEDFRCIAQPITRQLREHIENCILEKYQAAIA